MADPEYPNVPVGTPGVPPVHGDGGATTVSPVVVTADRLPAPALAPWGVYNAAGDPIITPDTFVSIDYAASYSLSTYPVEDGAFQTYNKVERPFEARVTFAKGGSVADREQFISDCETARKSLDLYSIVTPEQTFSSVNIESFSYERVADKGANLILADLHFLQIRTTASSAYTTTANPNGANPQNVGTVQAASATGPQASAASGGAS